MSEFDCRYRDLTKVDRTDSGVVSRDHYSDSFGSTKLTTVQPCLLVWLLLVPRFSKTPENSETSLCLVGFDWLLIYCKGNETQIEFRLN